MSRICQEIDAQVQAFLNRPLESSSYAYVYLDATYLKGRLGSAGLLQSRGGGHGGERGWVPGAARPRGER